eukprot:4004007-Heterocapsa_arctica.AAC.1
MAKACRLLIGVGHSKNLMSAVELSAVFLMARYSSAPVSPGHSWTTNRSSPLAVRTARASVRVKDWGVPRVVTFSSASRVYFCPRRWTISCNACWAPAPARTWS